MSFSPTKNFLIAALIAMPLLLPAQDRLTKHQTGIVVQNSHGVESARRFRAPGTATGEFVTVGNTQLPSGEFVPVVQVVTTDFDIQPAPAAPKRIEFVSGVNFQQSATAICQNPHTGNQYMGISLTFSGTEYAYLVKLDTDGNALWAHLWGRGRLQKALFNAVDSNIVIMGHRHTGRLFVASLNPQQNDPVLGHPYDWRQEDEMLDGTTAIPLIARDMTIDQTRGTISVLAESQHPGRTSIAVFHHNSAGLLQWSGDYGITTLFFTPRAICLGPADGPALQTVVVAAEEGGIITTHHLDAANGNIVKAFYHSILAGCPTCPSWTVGDMEWNTVSGNLVVVGQQHHMGNNDAFVMPINPALGATGFYFLYNCRFDLVSPSNSDFIFRNVLVEDNGDLVLTGSAVHNNTVGVEGGHWMLRTDQSGFAPTFPWQFAGTGSSAGPSHRQGSARDYQILDPPVVPVFTKPIFALQGSGCTDYIAFKQQPEEGPDKLAEASPLVWPNPVARNGMLTIAPNTLEEPVTSVEVYDLAGHRAAIEIISGKNAEYQLYVSTLSAGMYIAVLRSKSKTMRTTFVVE